MIIEEADVIMQECLQLMVLLSLVLNQKHAVLYVLLSSLTIAGLTTKMKPF